MRQDENARDMTPDAELRTALRSLEGDPPLESVDWERLRGSIHARAELPLARLRARTERDTVPSGVRRRVWRPLTPLAAAAGIALAVWLGGDRATQEVAPTEQISAEEVLHADLSEHEIRLLVSGRADPEALLLLALDES